MNKYLSWDPHRAVSLLLPLASGLASWTLSHMACFSCDFFQGKFDENNEIGIGFFSIEYMDEFEAYYYDTQGGGSCRAWPDSFLFDSTWQVFGQRMSLVVSLSGILALFSVLAAVFISSSSWLLTLGVHHATNGFLNLILFYNFFSNICDLFSCTLGPGGYLLLVSSMLWVASAIVILSIHVGQQRGEKAIGNLEERPPPLIPHNGESDDDDGHLAGCMEEDDAAVLKQKSIPFRVHQNDSKARRRLCTKAPSILSLIHRKCNSNKTMEHAHCCTL